ncbi:MAG: autotransporter-associated beta strand repeat-containing protein [Planctomycetota bacterium]|nr:autotransporter-associated beta strand repeat-containing protein [Planctomycetota bacterium]
MLRNVNRIHWGLAVGLAVLVAIAPATAGALDTLAITLGVGDSDVTVTVTGSNSFTVTGVAPVTITGTNVGVLTITGDGGPNKLTVDFSTNMFAGVINFNGGAGNNTLVIKGSFTTATCNYTNAHDGNINLDGTVVSYLGLSPVNIGSAADVIFNLPAAPSGPSDAILEDDGTPGDGVWRLRSNPVTFEQTDFNATNSVTINRGDPADTLTINAPADFNVGLTVGSGASLATVTVNNPLTLNAGAGNLAVDAGAINLNADVSTSATQAYNGPVTLGANANLTGTTATFNSTVDGAHTLTVTGNAVFNGIVGTTALSSLQVTGTTNINTTAVTTSTTQRYDGAVTLASSTVLTGTTSVSFNGNIVGGGFDLTVNSPATAFGNAGGDSVTGVGTLTTDAAGATTITAGTVSGVVLTFNDDVTLGANTILTGTTSVSFKGNIVGGGNNLTVDSPATAFGDLAADSVTGVGTLTTDAAGATTITAGTVSGVVLTFNDNVTLGASATLTHTGANSLTISGTLTTGGNTLTDYAAAPASTSGTISGQIAGAGGLTKDGPGTLLLTNSSPGYTGSTTVTAGTLQVQATASIASSAVTVDSNGTLSGTGATGAIFVTAPNTGTVSPGSPANTAGMLTCGGVSFGDNNATFVVQLFGTATYDQLNVTAGGTVNLNGCTLNVSVIGGFLPVVGSQFTIINNVAAGLIGGTFNSLPDNATFTASGYGFRITYTGVGNHVVLTCTQGAFVWTGQGVDGGGNPDPNWTIGNNWQGGVPPNPGANLVFGAGALQKTTCNNDYADLTAFNSINFEDNGYTISGVNRVTLGAGGIFTTAAATGANTLGVPLVIPAACPVTTTAGTLTLSGVVSGAGGLTKGGTGTLVLSGNNSYGGVTSVNAGILNIQNSNALGATGAGADTTVANTGTLQLQGGIAVANEVLTLNGTGAAGNGALDNAGGNNSWAAQVTLNAGCSVGSAAGTLTVSGQVTGATDLIKAGAGTLVLSNGTNNYTGATIVNGGTLSDGAANAIPAGSALTVAGGATFDLNGINLTVPSVTGAGTVTNNGAAATFTVNNAAADTFDGVLAGGANLNVTANGTAALTLTGTSAGYSGTTTIVSGATLVVTGSIANSTVEVQTGGTLRGTGTVGQINCAGTVAPGTAAAVGTLNCSGASFTTGTLLVRIPDAGAGATDTGRTTVDRLIASGDMSFGSGSHLAVNLNGAPASCSNTQVAHAGGTVTGTFGALDVTNNATGKDVTTEYLPEGAPQDVIVHVNIAPTGDLKVDFDPIGFDVQQGFHATVTDKDGNTLTYTWNFGEPPNFLDSTDSSTNAPDTTYSYSSTNVPYYTFDAAGLTTVTATVTITDGFGGKLVKTVTFTLFNPLGNEQNVANDLNETDPTNGVTILTKGKQGVMKIDVVQVYDPVTQAAVNTRPTGTTTMLTGPNGITGPAGTPLWQTDKPTFYYVFLPPAGPGPGVYLITVLDSAGKPLARKMLNITEAELDPTGKAVRRNATFSNKDSFITGRFSFKDSRQDQVKFLGKFPLEKEYKDPATGNMVPTLAPTVPHLFTVGIGNIIGNATMQLTANGRGTLNGRGPLTSVYDAQQALRTDAVTRVKFRYDPGTAVAILDVMLRLKNMSKAGFDTEGVIATYGKVGTATQRVTVYDPNVYTDAQGTARPQGVRTLGVSELTPLAIQISLLIDNNISYYSLIPSGFLVRNGVGQIVGHKTSRTK